jgi:hypothetical protein
MSSSILNMTFSVSSLTLKIIPRPLYYFLLDVQYFLEPDDLVSKSLNELFIILFSNNSKGFQRLYLVLLSTSRSWLMLEICSLISLVCCSKSSSACFCSLATSTLRVYIFSSTLLAILCSISFLCCFSTFNSRAILFSTSFISFDFLSSRI